MNRYFYDLHIHSCLSPCADNDMTPNNIAGMAALKGLQIVALTDHNSCRNCPAFFDACKKQGLIAIAGMELTTAEDIHLICLFELLETAMRFDQALSNKRINIKNRTDIFGEQIITDAEDTIVGYEQNLLPVATTLTIEAAYSLAKEYSAVVYPAHIDRRSNGIVSTLGTFPNNPPFKCAELKDSALTEHYRSLHPVLSDKKIITSSDAHYLWDISEAGDANSIMLDDTPYSGDLVRKRLFEYLNG
ncbi:MAG: phosphoesterase [Firmicutes bacterium HGW-Firmicutes-21]|nr:MAG: phosphoesterase [Firmicutes bacterium HGW-Firmicutes-21]